jgi:choice-of-anchor B domain-containing protein
MIRLLSLSASLCFALSLISPVNLSAQTLCENGMAGIYPCDGYDLYAHFPLEAVGGGDNGNDCWGWVDEASGREYVLFGRSNGTSFVEITDPLAPSFIATLPTATAPSLWRDMKVIGNYAYIVSEAFQHGLQIVDLTQLLDLSGFPYNITSTHYYSGFGSAHNVAVNPETNYVYGLGSTTFNGGLHIVDVSDPSNPVFAGSFDEFYTHDAHPVIYNGLDEDYQGKEIVFCFNGSNGVAIVNAEDKSDVQLIQQLSYEDVHYTHQGWISEDHRFVYFNDELDETNLEHNTRTYIMNVDDLDNPFILGYYDADNLATDHNLYTHNGRVYASNYRSGLRVFDILEDGFIEPFGFFDTYPEDNEHDMSGTWSNYPYFPSGSIAISNINNGLYIVRSADNVGVEDAVIPTTPVLTISPNPANYTVKLNGAFANCDIVIFDMAGREVNRLNTVPSTNGLNINISNITEGVYLVNLLDSKTGNLQGSSKLVVSPR